MCKGVQFWLLALSLVAITGCRMIDNRTSKGPCPQFSFADSDKQKILKGKKLAGTLESGDILVFYQDNLETQADCIARQINKQFSCLRELTGFEMAFEQIRVYLLWKDKIEWFDTIFDTQFVEAGGGTYGMVLYVQKDDASCEATTADNDYPYTFIHEVTELSFDRPCDRMPVLNDYLEKDGFQPEKINYTRWFRDGFANYAGYLAHKVTISDDSFDRGHIPPAVIEWGMHSRPFSWLSEIRVDLFTWIQDNPTPAPRKVGHAPNLPRISVDYYDAALGLFLVIEDKCGTDGIKKVILGIDPQKPIDGQGLIKLFNETLNTDIKQLVENFHFPRTGLYTEEFYPVPKTGVYTGEYSTDEIGARWGIKDGAYDKPQSNIPAAQAGITDGIYVTIVEPNSPAEQAGIRKWDIICQINGKQIRTNLDYELAIYEFMDQQSVTVDIWRDEEGEVTTELKLKDGVAL